MIRVAIEPATTQPLETIRPLPLAASLTGWRRWISPLLSLAVLVVALFELRDVDLAAVGHLPRGSAFWLLFAAGYMILPASEWLIYRRLWRLPPGGLIALMRKRISNDVLLGYSGEAYFYGWVRRHATISNAPFGAIKDVALLSAAVGNGATLLLFAMTWPLLRALHLGLDATMLGLSCAGVALISLGSLCFRRALFSLPARDLRFIAIVHTARVAGALVLTALLWSTAMPAAPLAWWLLLTTVRMLISRLPFVANKDIIFAGVVAFTMGREAEIAGLIAMLAALTLALNLALGAALALADLAMPDERA